MGRPLPFWPSEAQAGKPLHPAHTQRSKVCGKCGKSFLFWHVWNGGDRPMHRLHHYADLGDGKGPRFILHRCGFTSSGDPIRRETPNV